MSTPNGWHDVSRGQPCPICGKPDWCSISDDGAVAMCRRLDTGEGQPHIDRAGSDFWVYRLDGTAKTYTAPHRLPAVANAACAHADTLNSVYRALLALLSMSPLHRTNLQ